MKTSLSVLVIDLEYTRDEINEPINIDTVMASFDKKLLDRVRFDLWYRTLGDLSPRDPGAYDLVFISTKVSSGEVLKDLLKTFSDTLTVVGGVIATYLYEELLESFPNLILSLGEGENSLSAILEAALREPTHDAVCDALSQSAVPGVAFVKDGVRTVHAIRPAAIETLTEPLCHRTLETTLERNGLIRIEGSRGCPWNQCTFCSVAHKYGAGWRAFPLEKTLSEIVTLASAGAENLYFTDEDFFGGLSHFTALFSGILELKEAGKIPKNTAFWGSTSVYTLMRFGDALDESLALAKKAGVGVLFLGIESGSASQLKRYRKGVTKEENRFILQKLKDAGIRVDVGFIMFDAETTLDEVRENLDFCYETGLTDTVSRLAKPLRVMPHTVLAAHYEKEGLLLGEWDVNEVMRPFRFRDKKVEALFHALEKLDQAILDKANRMQAAIRMSGGYEDSTSLKALLTLRHTEYRFIEAFLKEFADRDTDPEAIDRLIEPFLSSLTPDSASD
ncbi:MAG: B12-binding domain-containing radical SAM protein [Clostridia bacterium]|nr:B12-binding domain-containing radical SAM protein [Clostridia bacterium]